MVICRRRRRKKSNLSTNEEMERETEFINNDIHEPTFCVINNNPAYSPHTAFDHDTGSDNIKTEFSISSNCAYGISVSTVAGSHDDVVEETVYDLVEV